MAGSCYDSLKEEKSHPDPRIEIVMSDGAVIRAELYPGVAPNTVNNFISLVKKGFYDGLSFHRIIGKAVLQAGDPDGNGMGGPGYAIRGEYTNNGFQNDLKHREGVISMARALFPDSAGSQFFITSRDMPAMDGEYAAFGKVISGMEAVKRIAGAETDYAGRPVESQFIYKITVETFGVEYPEPDKL